MADQRIVSLLPSATEIVSSLGFKEGLVGRSHECDFPPGISHLPVCTEPKFNPRGSSRDIDRQVKALLEEALSVYRVHADLLRRLKPGLIVTQSQCEVCAVSECDFPPGISHLPVCTEPKFNPRGSSRDIDRQVKALLEEALSVYRVHADLLRRLKPGLIVTQSQCEVCAVSETDLIDVVESWVDSRPQLVSLPRPWRGFIPTLCGSASPLTPRVPDAPPSRL